MTANDRRMAIVDFISMKRKTSYRELQEEFGVSESTIRRDLDAVSNNASFYTESGNGGGIIASEGWYSTKRYYTREQEEFLKGLQDRLQLERKDQKMMEQILATFAMPQAKA